MTVGAHDWETSGADIADTLEGVHDGPYVTVTYEEGYDGTEIETTVWMTTEQN